MGGLPPVFIEFLGKSTGVKTAMRDVKAELGGAAVEGETSFSKFGRVSKAAVAGIGIAAAGAAVASVKMAADFQTQMTRVRTGAGETAANMKMVSAGVLAMAGQVGESTSHLTTGLYTVESAGYHGADALNVLKNSAMGAKVGAADLGTVTDAVTTALNAYKMGASQATSVVNALVGTEAEGKTNMEALAGSMANVLPTAAAAHVGLNEVLGAMATMTAQGTPAANAATYLRQTIGMLSNPSAKAADEMRSLGLNAVQVGQNLGKNGLASTLNELTGAIEQHMGPAGTVLINHLKSASNNTTAFQKVLADLPPTQQTYVGALATMVGGTKSMQAALELTGPHMKDFQKNTAGIAQHVKDGGNAVEGWSDVQKTLNQKLAEAKAGLQALVIQIGSALLPVATRIMGVVAQSVTWLTKHKQIATALAIVIGGALVFAMAALAASLWTVAAAAAANPLTWIILAVVAVIAAIVLLIMHWRQVWAVIKSIAADVGRMVGGAWDWVASHTAAVWHDITHTISTAWNAVGQFFAGAWHMVADPIVGAWRTVQRVTTTVWNAILGFFRRWWPLLLVLFATPIAILLAIWNHCHTTIANAAKAVWSGILGFFRGTWNALLALAGMAWALIQAAIVAPAKATWGVLRTVWTAVVSFLVGQWHLLEGLAGEAWALIRAAVVAPAEAMYHDVNSFMSKIASAIWNQLMGAWHKAKGIGSSFVQVGEAIVSGIITGVESKAGSLFGSLENLASGALSSAKSFLGIHSPSRKFAAVGAYVGAGLIQGLEGTQAQVRAASNRISQELYREFGSSSHEKLQALVRKDGAELNKLASHRSSIATQLKGANKQLAALQKDWAKTQKDVASNIMQSVSVVTAVPDGAWALSPQDVIGNMAKQVRDAQKFANQLQDLRKKGLSTDLVQQIAAQGVAGGGATAAALDTASGAQIRQLNSMQKQAKSAANSVGNAVADSMYKNGIESAKGLVKGLASQQKQIQAQMNKIAKSMADTIRKALGIHSPSRVMAEVGDYTAQGLAAGISSGTRHAVNAAASMAQAVTTAGRPQIPRYTAAGGAGAGTGGVYAGAPIVVEATVIAQLDGQVLYKAVQKQALTHERRNTSNGLTLARKG